METEASQSSLDKWGKQLLENILLTAAEKASEDKEVANSIDVTLTFRLTPLVPEQHLEVRVAFEHDPALIVQIPWPF